MLSVFQHIGTALHHWDTWARSHSLGATLIDAAAFLISPVLGAALFPSAEASRLRWGWHLAQRNPQIAAVIAAIATWYIGGWGAAALGWGETATTFAAGASSGFAGGFVGARASGADLSIAFRAGYQGAAIGGTLAFVGSVEFNINPSTNFSWKSAASQFESAEARYEVGRFAQNKLGMSGLEFDAILTAASFIGNELVGDRIKSSADGDSKWISGILSRNLKTAVGFFAEHPTLDKIIGLPFDAVDIVLGYQGLPTATGWEIINSDTLRAQVLSSHSLGTLDMKTQSLLGVLSNGSMFSLPFGNIAPEGVSLTIGSNDPVNGFGLGSLGTFKNQFEERFDIMS